MIACKSRPTVDFPELDGPFNKIMLGLFLIIFSSAFL